VEDETRGPCGRARVESVSRAILFAAVASTGLLLGSAIGAAWRPPRRFVAALLAFASGSLTAALALELFAEKHHDNLVVAGFGVAGGATVFIVLAAALERRWPREKATGFALLAAVTLDGVPENLALGVTLVEQGSLALLAAIFFSNLAESLGGTADMREGGDSALRAIVLWTGVAGLLAAAVIGGKLLGATGDLHGFLLAFAGGAVLASLADTLMPEAYREGGPFVAFATVAGFMVSFLLVSTD
jgi:ZIP family zinc transporter